MIQESNRVGFGPIGEYLSLKVGAPATTLCFSSLVAASNPFLTKAQDAPLFLGKTLTSAATPHRLRPPVVHRLWSRRDGHLLLPFVKMLRWCCRHLQPGRWCSAITLLLAAISSASVSTSAIATQIVAIFVTMWIATSWSSDFLLSIWIWWCFHLLWKLRHSLRAPQCHHHHLHRPLVV